MAWAKLYKTLQSCTYYQLFELHCTANWEQHGQQFKEVIQVYLVISYCLNWGSWEKYRNSLATWYCHLTHPCYLLHEVCVKTTEMALLAQFRLYQKMLENRPHLKLKNNAISFFDIFQSEQNWASYIVFVKTGAARTMLGPIVMAQQGARTPIISVYACTAHTLIGPVVLLYTC